MKIQVNYTLATDYGDTARYCEIVDLFKYEENSSPDDGEFIYQIPWFDRKNPHTYIPTNTEIENIEKMASRQFDTDLYVTGYFISIPNIK